MAQPYVLVSHLDVQLVHFVCVSEAVATVVTFNIMVAAEWGQPAFTVNSCQLTVSHGGCAGVGPQR